MAIPSKMANAITIMNRRTAWNVLICFCIGAVSPSDLFDSKYLGWSPARPRPTVPGMGIHSVPQSRHFSSGTSRDRSFISVFMEPHLGHIRELFPFAEALFPTPNSGYIVTK